MTLQEERESEFGNVSIKRNYKEEKVERKGNNESKLQRERESEIGTVAINRCNNN